MKKVLASYESVETTNKMQPCNRIYYYKFIEVSTCFERLTSHHEELQTVFASSGLYTHVVTSRCPGWVGTAEAANTVWSS
jgi:hypothetical protein